jgi:hypothetical protein
MCYACSSTSSGSSNSNSEIIKHDRIHLFSPTTATATTTTTTVAATKATSLTDGTLAKHLLQQQQQQQQQQPPLRTRQSQFLPERQLQFGTIGGGSGGVQDVSVVTAIPTFIPTPSPITTTTRAPVAVVIPPNTNRPTPTTGTATAEDGTMTVNFVYGYTLWYNPTSSSSSSSSSAQSTTQEEAVLSYLSDSSFAQLYSYFQNQSSIDLLHTWSQAIGMLFVVVVVIAIVVEMNSRHYIFLFDKPPSLFSHMVVGLVGPCLLLSLYICICLCTLLHNNRQLH